MRDLLIRYLLGELDSREQQQLEERLRNSPELRRELAHLRSCFAAASDADPDLHDEDLPRGLAERTSQRITDSVWGDGDADSGMPALSSGATSDSPPVTALGWTLADLAVAGGVFLAVSMLLFPALRDSRDATRAVACQDHQRQLWNLFTTYAENNGGHFPRIAPAENAGMFAMQLAEENYIEPDALALLLVCPGAPLADKIRSGEFVIRIPTRARLAVMSPPEQFEARRDMSPCYAYQLPYRIGDRFYYPDENDQFLAPVLSDTSDIEPGQLTSPNHHGVLQVLFRDGNVKLLQSCQVPAFNDDLYRNARGVVAAGCNQHDAVLGRSESTPAIEAFVPGP